MVGVDGLALGGAGQIPAGREKAPGARQDAHAQVRRVAQAAKGLVERQTGGHIDGIGLGAVQGDGEHAAVGDAGNSFSHGLLRLIESGRPPPVRPARRAAPAPG